MEELKKKEEQKQIDSVKENPTALPPTLPDAKETILPKSSTSLTAEDLDAFLLGDLGSDDEGLGKQHFIYTFFYFGIIDKGIRRIFLQYSRLLLPFSFLY